MANGFVTRDKGKSYVPSGSLAQIGKGAGAVGNSGNLNVQIAGNVSVFPSGGANGSAYPGGTAADYVLAVYSLPANTLDLSGRTINIEAAGQFVGPNTNSKRTKIYWNPTTAVVGSTVVIGSGSAIADTGAYTTSTTTSPGWQLSADIIKSGANGSNTQVCIHQSGQIGSTVSTLLAPTFGTATENGAILIAVTGAAGTATTDISMGYLCVSACN